MLIIDTRFLTFFLLQVKGNHVIQRMLQKILLQCSKFIFDAVTKSAGDVARRRYICCATSGDDLMHSKINKFLPK